MPAGKSSSQEEIAAQMTVGGLKRATPEDVCLSDMTLSFPPCQLDSVLSDSCPPAPPHANTHTHTTHTNHYRKKLVIN